MKLLIDTNVIIDYLADRSFADQAEQIIEACNDGKADGFLTASAVTDIYFILKRITKANHSQLIDSLKNLFLMLDITSVDKTDVFGAMDIDFPDFEDALVSWCAEKINADYIITQNIKDFHSSAVKAVTPEEFLKKHK